MVARRAPAHRTVAPRTRTAPSTGCRVRVPEVLQCSRTGTVAVHAVAPNRTAPSTRRSRGAARCFTFSSNVGVPCRFCLYTVVATIARWRNPSGVFHEVASRRPSCRVRDLFEIMAWAAANYPPQAGGEHSFLVFVFVFSSDADQSNGESLRRAILSHAKTW